MIMCIQNLVKFCPFILKIWSKNLILESIKGRNSVANLRKTTIYFTNVDLVNDSDKSLMKCEELFNKHFCKNKILLSPMRQ